LSVRDFVCIVGIARMSRRVALVALVVLMDCRRSGAFKKLGCSPDMTRATALVCI